ncbi:MAG: TonB-dependent receptor [Edaphobacter sp.]|uniref:TonB-dependent receptor n=1 Tax=Edaphobacter sp. TaxID=1934404 RepID=UPI00239E9043|nr:TonB-dependent receptor [Edaphobacter sp.]MDE1175045.1 TonB-dependent receptor [Edaphobacter sp.]
MEIPMKQNLPTEIRTYLKRKMTPKSSLRSHHAKKSKVFSCFLVGAFGVLCTCLCLAGVTASAQVTGLATLSGTVTDSTQSVITEAHVTVRNTETGVSQSSVTNSSGFFEVDSLTPGVYRISVVAPGFQTLIRTQITLQADARINVPLKLRPGNTTETVTVTADASLLNMESGTGGQILTTAEMQALPISGENTFQLIEMAPGVQSSVSQGYSMSGTLGWNGVSKMGTSGQPNANEYSVDGAPNQAGQRGNAISLSTDEIGEMKIDVSGYDASVGHTMGIAVTQTTRNGTNDLHGGLRWLYQNRRWAAMNHFQGLNYKYQKSVDNCYNGAKTSPKCFLDENQFGYPGVHEHNAGFGIGGPFFIPKLDGTPLYDGRNKLFWFTGYDNDVFTDAAANTTTVPTLLERGGNFSDLPVQTTNVPAAFISKCGAGTPYYGQYQIYNPYTATYDSSRTPRRDPVCGNILPASMMQQNSMAKIYNSLTPAPTNGSATGNNFVYVTSTPNTFRQFVQRFDYAASQMDHAFFRWSRAHASNTLQGFTVGNVDRRQVDTWVDTGALGWNHVFDAKTNLDVTVGASQRKQSRNFPGYDQYKPSDVGLPGYADDYAKGFLTLPTIAVSGYQKIGNMDAGTSNYRVLAVRANLTRVAGSHTLRGGFEWRLQNYSIGAQANTSGIYTFDNTYTQQNNNSDHTYTQQNYGLAYAALLAGVQTNSQVNYQSSLSIGTPYYAGYIGDTWRVSPRLTIIPGIRYEYEYGPVEKHDRQIVGWDPTASLPIAAAANLAYQAARAGATAAQQAVLPASLIIQGGPQYAGVNGAPRNQFANNSRVLPRLAVAYQLNERTVLRGGVGLFSDTLNATTSPGTPLSLIGGYSGGGAGKGTEAFFTSNQDGYSSSTTVNSSNVGGTDFVAGTSPLGNPFPVNASGSRFNQPIGSAAGAMYYAGGNPSIYDHNLTPTRLLRGYFGIQHQFGASTMVEVAWTGSLATRILMPKNTAPTPASFYKPGPQPNTAQNTDILSTQLPNPFLLANFSSLAASNPTQYSLISSSSYFTAKNTSIYKLLNQYPQMNGLTLYQSLGESKFQEIQVNVTKRLSNGFSLMAALQLNHQRDRNYFANSFDPSPSWEASNNSTPYRVTLQAVFRLPFGRGHTWANSGWKSALFSGYQISTTYETQPGWLINFPNLFYIGKPDSKKIQLKHPVFVNNGASANGGYNYIQWLNVGNVTATYNNGVCTYTGEGFVTNPQCQPSNNSRSFPTYFQGVHLKGPNAWNVNVQRTFRLKNRVSLETRFEAFDVFNQQLYGAPNTTPTSPQFGQVTVDGYSNGGGLTRWLDISGHIRF